MQFYDFYPAELQHGLNVVNATYWGNVRLDINRKSQTRAGDWRISAVLRVHNSRAVGARLSGSGRHTPAASWEVHRDFMRALFAINPKGRIKTMLADYRGAECFEREFPKTREALNDGGSVGTLYDA